MNANEVAINSSFNFLTATRRSTEGRLHVRTWKEVRIFEARASVHVTVLSMYVVVVNNNKCVIYIHLYNMIFALEARTRHGQHTKDGRMNCSTND